MTLLMLGKFHNSNILTYEHMTIRPPKTSHKPDNINQMIVKCMNLSSKALNLFHLCKQHYKNNNDL